MEYKVRMACLKVLSILLLIISAPIFILTIPFCYALSIILHAWRWVVRESIDEDLTAAWNDLTEAMNLEDELAIDF